MSRLTRITNMEANLKRGYKVKRHFTRRIKTPISKSYKAMATRDIENANAGKFGRMIWTAVGAMEFKINPLTSANEPTGKYQRVQGTYCRAIHGEIGRRER